VVDTIDAVMVGHVGCHQVDGLLTPMLVRKILIFYYQQALKNSAFQSGAVMNNPRVQLEKVLPIHKNLFSILTI